MVQSAQLQIAWERATLLDFILIIAGKSTLSFSNCFKHATVDRCPFSISQCKEFEESSVSLLLPSGG